MEGDFRGAGGSEYGSMWTGSFHYRPTPSTSHVSREGVSVRIVCVHKSCLRSGRGSEETG